MAEKLDKKSRLYHGISAGKMHIAGAAGSFIPGVGSAIHKEAGKYRRAAIKGETDEFDDYTSSGYGADGPM